MNKAEKSRPQRQPGAGQAETACGARFPHQNCTTDSAERQPGFIASLLSHGAENGLTLSDLHRLTGKDKRVIRAEIQQERLSGTPILSDNLSGYFLPANEDERERCVKSLRHRASEIFRTAAAIKGAAELSRQGLRQIEGQLEILETAKTAEKAAGGFE